VGRCASSRSCTPEVALASLRCRTKPAPATPAFSVRRAKLERRLQSAGRMLLARLPCAVITASLLLACGHSAAPPVSVPSPPPSPPAAAYLVIAPDVSVSRTAAEYQAKQESVDANSDVMAEILAIPPGG
jgi:hypothetical protein